MRVRVLGAVEATWQGAALPWMTGADASRLLVYLLLHPDLPLAREQVAFTLWPDSGAAQARQALNRSLHRLVDYLDLAAPGPLARDSRFLRWSSGPDWWLDALALEDTARRAALEADAVAGDWDRVVALWGGELCPGWPDEWLQPLRQRLRRRYLEALDRQAQAREAAADWSAAAAALARLLAEEPLREAVLQRFLVASARAGDRPGALAAFDRFAAEAARQLGVAPTPATAELAEQLRQGLDPVGPARAQEPAVAASGGGRIPRALGRFVGRAGELARGEALLGRGRLVTVLGPGGAGKTRLAVELARQVAAHYDQASWLELARLSPGEDPAAFLARGLGIEPRAGVAPGDQAAKLLGQGRWLLVLDNCEHLVPTAGPLATALLGACPALRILATSREPLGQPGELTLRLPPLPIPAAGAELSAADLLDVASVQLFVDRVSEQWPDLSFDRPRLTAVARICRRVEGIPLAIELAAARVGVLSVEALADRLAGGFGLLRAGRGRVPRQQTMAGVIDWSYQLLGPDEQAALRQLAVFVDGFELEAAAAVCGPAVDPRGAAELASNSVARLVEKSLVTAPPPEGTDRRLRLTEIVREFAAERLAEAGEAEAAGRRHAAWFAALAAAAAASWTGPERAGWLERLDRDEANLWAAFEGLRRGGEPEAALAMGLDLWRWWYVRGHVTREREALAALMAGPGAPRGSRQAGDGQSAVAALAYRHGDMAMAREWCELGRSTFRDLGDEPWYARLTEQLVIVALASDSLREALRLAEEAVAVWSGLGDAANEIRSRTILADALLRLGELEQARPLLEDSLARLRLSADEDFADRTKESLVYVYWQQGHYDRAAALLEERMARATAAGSRVDVALLELAAGLIAMDQGRFERAEAHFRRSLALGRELEQPRVTARSLHNLGELALRRGDVAVARSYLSGSLAQKQGSDSAWSQLHTRLALATLPPGPGDPPDLWTLVEETRALGARDLLATALRAAGSAGSGPRALAALAEGLRVELAIARRRGLAQTAEALAIAMGDPAAAARLLGFAEALRRAIGAPCTAAEVQAIAALRQRLAERLGDGAAAEMLAGAEMGWDEARALAEDPSATAATAAPGSPGGPPGA